MPVYFQNKGNNYRNEMLIVSNQLRSIVLDTVSSTTMRIKPSPSTTMENHHYRMPVKLMFSVVSVCLSVQDWVSVQGPAIPCTDPWSHPSCSGSPTQTCSNLLNLDLTVQPSPPPTCSNLFTMKHMSRLRAALRFGRRVSHNSSRSGIRSTRTGSARP